MMAIPSAPFASLFLVLAILPVTFSSRVGHSVVLAQPQKSCIYDNERLDLFVEARGTVRTRGESVTHQDLSEKVRDIMRLRASRVVFLSADTGVAYARVVAVIDSIKPYVDHIALVTPEVEQAGAGCYWFRLGEFRDALIPPSEPHMQPVPWWKIW